MACSMTRKFGKKSSYGKKYWPFKKSTKKTTKKPTRKSNKKSTRKPKKSKKSQKRKSYKKRSFGAPVRRSYYGRQPVRRSFYGNRFGSPNLTQIMGNYNPSLITGYQEYLGATDTQRAAHLSNIPQNLRTNFYSNI